VPFGGAYRIIDFALSNAVNSGLRRICVLTQYESLTLHRHIRSAWNILSPELDEFIYMVPPELRLPNRWYAGTADAVYQNIPLLQHEQPRWVLLLGGDHIYKMNYRPLIEFHLKRGAAATVVCVDVAITEADRFGVMRTDETGRILQFEEKPRDPEPMPGTTDRVLASMGIYLFDTETLVRATVDEVKRPDTSYDFGRDIFPRLISSGHIYAYNFNAPEQPGTPYWRDVGTLDSYWQANMDLLDRRPELDLYDTDWPIRSGIGHRPPGKVCISTEGTMGVVEQSLVAPGAIISGGRVTRSVIGPRVEVHNASTVEECVVMGGVNIGKGVRLRRCVIEESAHIPDGCAVGYDEETDRVKFKVSPGGIRVIPTRAPLP